MLLYQLSLGEKDIKYPGAGIALSHDTILVANTGHKEIIAIKDKGKDNSSIIWSLSTYSDMQRHSYKRVLDVKLDSFSNIWMNNTNKHYEKADTIVMDIATIKEYKSNINHLNIEVKDGHTQRIESKLLKYPTALASHKEGMLILDSKTFKILYTDNSYIPTLFGDSYVQNKFKRIAKKRAYYQNLINTLLWFFGLSMFLAILAAVIEAPRAMKEMKEESKNVDYSINESIAEDKKIEADENSIIWLNPTETFLKKLNLVLSILVISLPITIALVAYFSTPTPEYGLVFLMLIFIPIGFLTYKMAYVDQVAIGVDDKKIYIKSYFKKEAEASFEDIIFTGQKIIIGKVSLPLYFDNNTDILFDDTQFKYYIFPKLQTNQRGNEITELFKKFKNKEPDAVLTVIGATTILIYLLYNIFISFVK